MQSGESRYIVCGDRGIGESEEDNEKKRIRRR
jgi:hypothetical protein